MDAKISCLALIGENQLLAKPHPLSLGTAAAVIMQRPAFTVTQVVHDHNCTTCATVNGTSASTFQLAREIPS